MLGTALPSPGTASLFARLGDDLGCVGVVDRTLQHCASGVGHGQEARQGTFRQLAELPPCGQRVPDGGTVATERQRFESRVRIQHSHGMPGRRLHELASLPLAAAAKPIRRRAPGAVAAVHVAGTDLGGDERFALEDAHCEAAEPHEEHADQMILSERLEQRLGVNVRILALVRDRERRAHVDVFTLELEPHRAAGVASRSRRAFERREPLADVLTQDPPPLGRRHPFSMAHHRSTARSLRLAQARGKIRGRDSVQCTENGADPTPNKTRKEASVEQLPARAALVPAAQVAGGLTTTIARSDVEKALSADEPPALIVDITRSSDSAEAAETHSVAISWQRTELEELLRQATGGQIQLTFDAAALEQALSADVEAHGFREKVLILAVAATAAAGGAATAAGQPVDYGPSGNLVTAAQTQNVSPDDRAVSFGSATVASAPGADDRAVSFATPPAAATNVSPDDRAVAFSAPDAPAASVSPDDRAVPFSAPDGPVGSLSPDDRAVPYSAPDGPAGSLSPDDRAIPFSAPGAPAGSLSPDDRAVPFSAPDAPATSLSPDDRALPRSSPAPATAPTPSDDGGITISAPSPEAIAVGGAFLLAITGAAFAFANRGRVRPT